MQETQVISSKQRLICSVCNYRIDPNNDSAFFTFPCSIRSLMDEKFKVWRCPDCQTIHCLDVVDIDYYYSKYPSSKFKLHWVIRIIYGNLLSQLTKHGFSQQHSFLDYGCGVNGQFLEYLQQRGFTNSF